MPFVVDASVAVAWCFDDETTAYGEAILDAVRNEEAVVPAIWPLEMANALVIGERRGRLTEAQTLRFVELLDGLPITVDGEAVSGALGPVLTIAREYGLSVYDAAYLELAARRNLSLATQDRRLKEAAARLGVPLLS